MVWLHFEDIRFFVPKRVDGLIWRYEPERLELLGEIIGRQPVSNVASEFIDRRIVEGFDGCFLDGSDHAFGLAVGPRVIRLGQPMLDAVSRAGAAEDMADPALRGALIAIGELDAVVGQVVWIL